MNCHSLALFMQSSWLWWILCPDNNSNNNNQPFMTTSVLSILSGNRLMLGASVVVVVALSLSSLTMATADNMWQSELQVQLPVTTVAYMFTVLLSQGSSNGMLLLRWNAEMVCCRPSFTRGGLALASPPPFGVSWPSFSMLNTRKDLWESSSTEINDKHSVVHLILMPSCVCRVLLFLFVCLRYLLIVEPFHLGMKEATSGPEKSSETTTSFVRMKKKRFSYRETRNKEATFDWFLMDQLSGIGSVQSHPIPFRSLIVAFQSMDPILCQAFVMRLCRNAFQSLEPNY